MASESWQMLAFHHHQASPSASPPSDASPTATALDRDTVPKTRFPSACQECRRRKQKCSLTHPCTNCARRFPQPVCEYGVAKVKKPWGYPPGPKDRVTPRGGSGLYSHLDLDSIYDAILDVEGKLDLGMAVDHVSGVQPLALPQAYRQAHRKRPAYIMKDESWAGGKPFVVKFANSTFRDRNLMELLHYILQTRLQVANNIVQDEWEVDGRQLMRALHQTRGRPSQDIASLEDQMHRLPMEPTKMNKELVRTHLQLFSRFKASLDGSPRPNNRFMKHWIPFSIQDRLVLHVMLCTTASFLFETGRLPKHLLHIHRATTTRMLNEYISSPELCTSDSAMLAVNQLILTSWYWSSTEELHAHMSGFRRMIIMRGGCRNLGMEGFTSKIALLNDAVIAVCHDTEPVFFGHAGFEFEDAFRIPLQVNFNTPLLFDCPPFLLPSSSLRLHKHTAEILDNMRSLLHAVFNLQPDAETAQLDMISQMATLLLSLINSLPEQVLIEPEVESSRTLSGSKRKREDSDDVSPSGVPSSAASSDGTSVTEDPPDMVYVCVRLTALIWAKAIQRRVPTKDVCTVAEFVQIWSFAWAAGLDRWSTLSGIFAWMLIAIGPLCHSTVHARMAKTLTVATFTHIGTENWHVAADVATAALKIQAWLRAGKESKPLGLLSGAFGGERVIENYGFAFKENMPDLPDHRDQGQPEEDDEFSL